MELIVQVMVSLRAAQALAGFARGKRRFVALAIATPDSTVPVGPCGACRQVLTEFMPPHARVCFGGRGPERINTSLGELMPFDSLHDLCKSGD